MFLLIGLIFCILSVLILKNRIGLVLFGEKADGNIIGYCNRVNGFKGIDTYNYRVEYEYNGRTYSAVSLESVQIARNNIPNKNIHASVTVCFKKQKPEIVTIYDFKSTSAIGGIMFLLGILLVIIDVVI